MDACRRVDVRDPSVYPRHRLGRLGTIDGADRLAILPLDACHVQTILGLECLLKLDPLFEGSRKKELTRVASNMCTQTVTVRRHAADVSVTVA